MNEQIQELSKNFRERIVYQGAEHCVPHEFVLKALEIASFQQIATIAYFPTALKYLNALPKQIQDYDMEDLLKAQQIYFIPEVENLFNTFNKTIIPTIAKRSFHLGIDRTYMQEIQEKSEVIVDDEKELCLRWQRLRETQKSFISISLVDEFVMVGRRDLQGREFRGMKFYKREGYQAVEMGLWKSGLPEINLLARYPSNNSSFELYLRRFEGNKLLAGQLRYMSGASICKYEEGDCNLMDMPSSTTGSLH